MIKLVIYDLDGTLADTLQLHLDAYTYSLKKLGLNPPRAEIISKCFNKLDEQAAKVFNIVDVSSFSKYYREGVVKGFQSISLYPNALKALKQLRNKGYKIGIATARDRIEVEKAFQRLMISDYVDATITHDEVQKKKPDPEIFLSVCKQLEISLKDSIIVGDSENDIIAANTANMPSVLFFPKAHEEYYDSNRFKKCHPTYTMQNHLEIIDILETIK